MYKYSRNTPVDDVTVWQVLTCSKVSYDIICDGIPDVRGLGEFLFRIVM